MTTASSGERAHGRPRGVGQDGRRIKIFATSERLALRVAVSYLEGRFGRRAPREQACELGESTVGVPFVTH